MKYLVLMITEVDNGLSYRIGMGESDSIVMVSSRVVPEIGRTVLQMFDKAKAEMKKPGELKL